MNSKMILFNGPAGCGKNVAIDYMKGYLKLVDSRCKDKLFKLTQDLFNVRESRFWEIYNDRSLKEKPLNDFILSHTELAKLQMYLYPEDALYIPKGYFPISIRQAMIYVSELICKPAFGEDYFGKARAETLDTTGVVYVDDSCGFDNEIPPTTDKLGQESVLLLRIHGRGSFEGDSRNYISEGIVNNAVDIYNTNSIDDFFKEVHYHIDKFLNN